MLYGPHPPYKVCWDHDPTIRANLKEMSPHTHVTSQLIDYLIQRRGVRYVVECGSFRGGSMKLFVEAFLRKNMVEGEFVVHSIDPFTGDVNMWNSLRQWMYFKNLKPRLRDQFIANLIALGYQRYVISQQATAIIGLRNIILHSFSSIPCPDIVYIDSSHEPQETLLEISVAFRAVKVGGYLLGDDFHPTWPGVVQDVVSFARSMLCVNSSAGEHCRVDWDQGQPLPTMDGIKLCALMPHDISNVARLFDNCQWVIRKIR